MCENFENRGFRFRGFGRRGGIPFVVVLAVIASLAQACKDGGGTGIAPGSGGAGAGGGDAGAGAGGGGAGGAGGAGGLAGTGGPSVDGSSDGAPIGDGPLAFDLDGVRKRAPTAAAQIVVSAASQQTLRVLGMGGAFSLNVNLVGATAFAPGTYSCNPATASGSSLVYMETAPAKSYTSFEAGCSVTLTAIGAVNERVAGTFHGMVRSGAEAPRAITNGVFDVIRAQ